MSSVYTLLAAVTISAFVVRLASVALQMTGLSRDSARFQALSAFTGSGFTTAESEHIVNHPFRRRIIMRLMVIGAIGLTSVVTTLLMAALSDHSDTSLWIRVVTGGGGLLAIVLVIRNRWFDKSVCYMFEKVLTKTTELDLRDYSNLLHVASGWGVTEVTIKREGPLVGKTLQEINFRDNSVTVLGLEKKGEPFLGVPELKIVLSEEDRLLLYGRLGAISKMCEVEYSEDASGNK